MKTGTPIGPISNDIYEAIGRLCSAWSYLEFASEKMIWGIVAADEKTGRALTWDLDLRQRWKLIMKEAPKKHSSEEQKFISEINDKIKILCKDRNIIVHGLVHAAVSNPVTMGDVCVGGILDRAVAWSIFRGEDGGKSFPISLNAVQIVSANISKTSAQIVAFNKAYNYTERTTPCDVMQNNWPAPF